MFLTCFLKHSRRKKVLIISSSHSLSLRQRRGLRNCMIGRKVEMIKSGVYNNKQVLRNCKSVLLNHKSILLMAKLILKFILNCMKRARRKDLIINQLLKMKIVPLSL